MTLEQLLKTLENDRLVGIATNKNEWIYGGKVGENPYKSDWFKNLEVVTVESTNEITAIIVREK